MASSKQFGLVGVQSDPNSPLGYSPCAVGCCLSVRSCNTLPDGRSIIDTIGKARFRIVDNWEQDGYLVGKVVWLNDVLPSSEAERQQLQRTLQQLVDRVRALYARFASSTACASLSRLLQRITEMPDMGTTVEQWVRLSYWLCDTLPVDLQTKQHLVRTENIYAILGNRRQRCRELTCQRTRSLAVPQHSSRSTRVWNVCKRSKNAWIAQETHTAAPVPSCSAAVSLALSCSLCQSFIARVFVYSIVCVCAIHSSCRWSFCSSHLSLLFHSFVASLFCIAARHCLHYSNWHIVCLKKLRLSKPTNHSSNLSFIQAERRHRFGVRAEKLTKRGVTREGSLLLYAAFLSPSFAHVRPPLLLSPALARVHTCLPALAARHSQPTLYSHPLSLSLSLGAYYAATSQGRRSVGLSHSHR